MISQALIPPPKKKKTVFLKERTLLLFATLNDSNIDDRGHDLRQVSRIVQEQETTVWDSETIQYSRAASV